MDNEVKEPSIKQEVDNNGLLFNSVQHDDYWKEDKFQLNTLVKREALEFPLLPVKSDTNDLKLIKQESEDILIKTEPLVTEEFDIKDEITISDSEVSKQLTEHCFNSFNNKDENFNVNTTCEQYTCEICEYKTWQKPKYEKHISMHRKKIYQCDSCTGSFVDKDSLKQHVLCHDVKNQISCYNCDYKTFRKRNLIEHMKIHDEKNRLQCHDCDYETFHKRRLIRHIKCHKGLGKVYECHICEYKASTSTRLDCHLMIHSSEKPFKCNNCKFQSRYKHHLNRHMLIHSNEKPFQCSMCEYATAYSNALQVHMLSHHSTAKETLFSCKECKYVTAYKQYLRYHMKLHTQTARFNCNICNYKTEVKRDFLLHLHVHTGEKPFACKECDYKDTSKANLRLHILGNHTAEKPFKCGLCDYQSVTKYYLKLHMAVHEKNKNYKYKPRKNNNKPVNEKSVNQIITDKNFECYFCGYETPRKYRLRNHIMKIHLKI